MVSARAIESPGMLLSGLRTDTIRSLCVVDSDVGDSAASGEQLEFSRTATANTQMGIGVNRIIVVISGVSGIELSARLRFPAKSLPPRSEIRVTFKAISHVTRS